MTQTTRTTKRSVTFLLVPILSMIAMSGCGQDATSGGSDEPSGGTAGTGGSSTAAGGAAAGGTGSGTGGAATGGAATGGAATGGAATGGAAAGGTGSTGGAAAGGTGSGTGGAGTGGSTGGGGAGGTSGGSAGSGGSSSGPTFHVFMLMGQSNMAGVAPKQASDDNTDDRLKVLGGCNQTAGQWNIAKPPLSDCPGERGQNLSTAVDPGIWFGKTLLAKLPAGDTIGLVGTAESGESINTFITGGSHHQMILNKIAKAKMAPNARFAGVIFHQGESDSGQNTWPGKVVQLYNEVKAAWGVSYDVPFILGELPAGGCCSGHNTQVHAAADQLPDGYWISQDGTAVMDQYHFDHASVVLMGKRYGDKMIEALGW